VGHKDPSVSHRAAFKIPYSTHCFWQANNPDKAPQMTSMVTGPRALPGSIALSEMADEAALPSLI
jgi:hypothetical protein